MYLLLFLISFVGYLVFAAAAGAFDPPKDESTGKTKTP